MIQHIDTVQATVLAFIQGVTEFLPVSSSAHLALVPLISDWPDQGLAFDCMVHLGTLTAVILYFRQDLMCMATSFSRTLTARSWQEEPDGKMAWLILLATIPVGLAGLSFEHIVEHELRAVPVIAWASIVFGALLWWADHSATQDKTDVDWTLRNALLTGAAQAIALIPGTSRSGITMTAALMMGYSRNAAARFSFLLSMPVIILAGGLKIVEWIKQPDQAAGLDALLIGYLVSAITAYVSIHYFLKILNRTGMMPFAIYRIVLGIALLVFAI